MRSNAARLLFFTGDVSTNLLGILSDYDIDVTGTGEHLISLLAKRKYDAIVLDERMLGAQMALVTATIKHRYPLVPLVVIPRQHDDTREHVPPNQNIDELMPRSLNEDEQARFLLRVLSKSYANRTLINRSERLQSILTTTQALHNLAKDEDFIYHALDLIINSSDLYGASVAIMQRDIMKVYTVRAGEGSKRYHESIMSPHEYNPFMRVMSTGIVTLYEDVNIDQHHIAPPLLPDHHAAAFLPLRANKTIRGVLAVFRSGDRKIENEEIQYIELLADHMALALVNLATFDTQRAFAQSSELLLTTWEVLTSAKNDADLLRVLRQLAQTNYNAKDTLIWLYGESTPLLTAGHAMRLHANQATADTFIDLFQQQALNDMIDTVHAKLKPYTIWRKQHQGKPLERLFDVMGGEHLVFMPLIDSARMLGLMVISLKDVRDPLRTVLDRLGTLMHIAGQALERMVFIDMGTSQTRRIETILQHIPEAVIFIGAGGAVQYANAQVNEALQVNPDDLVGRDGASMLRMIADCSDDPALRYNQLTDALKRLMSSPQHPSIQLPMQISQRDMMVRLVTAANEARVIQDWAIILYTAAPSSPPPPSPNKISTALLNLLEGLPAPQIRLREISSGLSDYAESTTNKKVQALMLRSLEYEIERVGLMWNNLIAVGHLEQGELRLEIEPIDVNDLTQMVLESRFFRPLYRRCRVNITSIPYTVNADVTHTTQALTNVISYALEDTPPNSEATIDFQREGERIAILISHDITRYDSRSLLRLLDGEFDPAQLSDFSPPEFGMIIARQIFEAQGGSLEGHITTSGGLRLRVSLPAALDDIDSELLDTAYPVDSRPATPAVNSTPRREPKTMAVFKGSSSLMRHLLKLLDVQGYDLMSLKPDEYVNVLDVRVDLIIIDSDLGGEDALGLYRRIRGITTIPVVMVGDQAATDDRVEALTLGVEDYLTGPITDAELGARINVIINRTTLPDRTREPMRQGDLVIDFAKRQVFLKGQPVELTRLEYDLLHVLAINAGQVLTHQQLLTQVWGPEYRNATQYLWVNIRRLRQKIEPDASEPYYIRTQPRSGYYFYNGE